MDAATIGAVDRTYTGNSLSGAKSITGQIQLLQQQISLIEQSTLEESEKEARIAILEARIANLQQRLEILQSQEASASPVLEETSSALSDTGNIESVSASANLLYQPQGTTASADSGVGRLIAYA